MMFWDRDPEQYGRFLTGVMIPQDEAMIRLGRNWVPEIALGDEDLARLDDGRIAAMSGLDVDALKNMIATGIRQWRQAPTRSLINLLAADAPASGAPLFRTLLQQTQAIIALSEAGILDLNRGGPVRAILDANKKHVKLSGSSAMTLSEEGMHAFASALLALRLWSARNDARTRLGEIKLPKVLYRGVRTKNFRVEYDSPADADHPTKHCRRVAAVANALTDQPLAALSHSSILSFTSQRPIAEYFTKNEGFVLEIDPSRLEVICSWATDEALDAPDHILNRHEREWIVRVRDDLVLETGRIHEHDYLWRRSFADQRGIPMVDHHDVADYVLEGRAVRASFRYGSRSRGGSVNYAVDGGPSTSRSKLKKDLGFDPVPSDDRQASELVFRYRDPFLPRSNRDYGVLELGDVVSHPAIQGRFP